MIFKADESTKGATQELLEKALYKRAQGRGMTNAEISLVHAYDRARQHGETLYVKPYNDSPPRDDPREKRDNISIEDVEGLQQAIKKAVDTAITDADGGGGTVTTTYPFDITVNVSAGTFTLVTGTVNGIVPNNINNTFTISTVGTRYVYITCSAINGVFTGCTINVGSSQPAPIGTNIAYPQNSFNIPIHVVVNGTAFRVINRTSLQVLSKEVFRVQKSMFTPDTLPYDSYYTWSVSDV
jgi:hypothetical protein